MKRIKGRKLAALLCSAVLATTLLTGCGGEEKQTSGADFDKNLIYKATYYNKPEELSYIGTLQAGLDGKLYAQGYSEKEQREVIAQLNSENGELERVFTGSGENENTGVMNFTVGENGSLWRLCNTYIYEEENPENSRDIYFIESIDKEGNEVFKKELSLEDDFYPSTLLLDQTGNLIIGGSEAILVYSPQGEQLLKIEVPSYLESMVRAENGAIYAITYTEDYSARVFSRLDIEAKQLTEVRRLEIGVHMMNLISGRESLYLNDGTYLYRYDMETDEREKVLNWINSDVNGSNIYGLCSLPDGRFAGGCYDDLTQESQIIVLEKVPPEEVKDKQLVSLAMPYSDYNLNIAVIAFNKQSEDYRIIVEDYSQYVTDENYTAGEEKMNTDLISGKLPDLISIGNLPIGNYTSKGLLANLYERMDADSEFNRSDYMENIWKAYEKDGSLYSLVPSFNVQTVIAKEENVGKTPGWTMEDLEKLMAEQPEGTKIFENETQESILNRGLCLAIEQYIDYSTGTCSFDSEEFIKLLNFAKQFPKEYEDYNVEEPESDSMYAQDKVMLQGYYLYNYEQIHEDKYYNYGGSELTFIGFPTANKQGSAITGNMELAISAKAACPEGAWAFIKYLLGDTYQSSQKYEWPIKKSVYPALREEAMKPDTYIDEAGKEQTIENTVLLNGKEVKIGQVTEEEIKKVDELLNSVTQVMRYDTKVEEIITEETGAFFSDQKSAAEVAGLIQNRVQLYLSESK